jgi:hypothetical protein
LDFQAICRKEWDQAVNDNDILVGFWIGVMATLASAAISLLFVIAYLRLR